MKTFDAVQTEKRAIELLEKIGCTDIYPKGIERCECGETQCVRGYDEDYKLIAKVVVCEICGDDDAFEDEVVYYL